MPWTHLFPVAEERKEPKGPRALGKHGQPVTGGWVFCQVFSCQCQGDRTEISPESERLLKPGPLHLFGSQETDSLCSMGRSPGRGREQVGRSESWIALGTEPESGFSGQSLLSNLNFSEQKLYCLGVISNSTLLILFWECPGVEINSTLSSIHVPFLKWGMHSFFLGYSKSGELWTQDSETNSSVNTSTDRLCDLGEVISFLLKNDQRWTCAFPALSL